MPKFPDTMPSAWLGYAKHQEQIFAVRCCAWCPDKAQAEKLAKDAGFPVTHSICPVCLEILRGTQLELPTK